VDRTSPFTKSTLRAAIDWGLGTLDAAEEAGVKPGPPFVFLLNAASMLEKLLPGECEWCHGTGNVALLVGGSVVGTQQCTNCNGSGKVWDEDLIAAVRYCVPDEYPNGPPEAVLEKIVDTLTDTKEET
jgi:hypothetical protein